MRIRSIKPEFWRSSDISDLTIEDRLLFIGLWSYVDDNGVGVDQLHIVVAELFARDHFDNPRETVARVAGGLARLSEAGLIDRYTVSGRPFLCIVTWEQHQRVDKPNKPRYPTPDRRDNADRGPRPETSRDPRETLAESPRLEQGNRGAEEQGNRGAEEQRADARAVAAAGFNEFWLRYPRKVDKPAARKAWDRAIKRADIQKILDGAARYAADPNRVDQFTKHPGPWLNADAWDNPPLPHRSTSGRESSLTRRDRQREETFAELARLEQEQHPMGALGA